MLVEVHVDLSCVYTRSSRSRISPARQSGTSAANDQWSWVRCLQPNSWLAFSLASTFDSTTVLHGIAIVIPWRRVRPLLVYCAFLEMLPVYWCCFYILYKKFQIRAHFVTITMPSHFVLLCHDSIIAWILTTTTRSFIIISTYTITIFNCNLKILSEAEWNYLI